MSKDKQDIKRNRIRNYFLDAAKEIIINEGVDNVSVRKVADIAGYSYATIYNYFSDLNELLYDVKRVMINDLAGYIQEKTEKAYDKEGIKRMFRIYIAYFFENPNIFKFFYFHQTKPVTDSEISEPDYSMMWADTFREFVLEGKLKENDIEAVAKIFIYSMLGMLTLSFSNNGDLTEENVYRDLDKIVEFLLK